MSPLQRSAAAHFLNGMAAALSLTAAPEGTEWRVEAIGSAPEGATSLEAFRLVFGQNGPVDSEPTPPLDLADDLIDVLLEALNGCNFTPDSCWYCTPPDPTRGLVAILRIDFWLLTDEQARRAGLLD